MLQYMPLYGHTLHPCSNVKHQVMAHISDYGTSAIYTNDISVFLNTTISLVVLIKTSVYCRLASRILQSMLGLCCNKMHSAMTNQYDRDDGIDNNRNEDGNGDNNAASVEGYNGPIFDPVARPQSRLGLAEEDWLTKTIVL